MCLSFRLFACSCDESLRPAGVAVPKRTSEGRQTNTGDRTRPSTPAASLYSHELLSVLETILLSNVGQNCSDLFRPTKFTHNALVEVLSSDMQGTCAGSELCRWTCNPEPPSAAADLMNLLHMSMNVVSVKAAAESQLLPVTEPLVVVDDGVTSASSCPSIYPAAPSPSTRPHTCRPPD